MLMPKVNIHYKINNDYKELKGILNDNLVNFYDGDFKISFDFDKLILKRANDSYNLLLDFKNELFNYNYGPILIDSPIVILNKKKSSCFFEVSYRLADEVIKFYIDYEVI